MTQEEPEATQSAETPTKATRQRRGTVSLPGRGAAAAIVDAPSVVDDLRAQPMMPATTTGPAPAVPLTAPARPAATPTATPVTTRTAAPPPPPPRRQTSQRVQFSTKLPPQLISDVKDFCEHHQAEIQVVVELALREYLTSRGWEITS